MYEYEKLFQLNDDFTISPVINPRLSIGADIEPKKEKKRSSWVTRDSVNKTEAVVEKEEIPLCLINMEYE